MFGERESGLTLALVRRAMGLWALGMVPLLPGGTGGERMSGWESHLGQNVVILAASTAWGGLMVG